MKYSLGDRVVISTCLFLERWEKTLQLYSDI